MAPATTTAMVPVGPADNSTESGGAGESKEDMFAKLKEKFFNEMNKIPRKCPRGLGWGGTGAGPAGVSPSFRFRLGYRTAPQELGIQLGSLKRSGVYGAQPPRNKVLTQFRKVLTDEAKRGGKTVKEKPPFESSSLVQRLLCCGRGQVRAPCVRVVRVLFECSWWAMLW